MIRPVSPQWAWAAEVVIWGVFIATTVWLVRGPWWDRHRRVKWMAQGFAVFLLLTTPLTLALASTPLLRSRAANSNVGVLAQLAGMVAVTIAGIYISRWAWRRLVLPGWAWLIRAGTVRRGVALGTLAALIAVVALRVWLLIVLLAVTALVYVLGMAAAQELGEWSNRWKWPKL